MLVQELCYVEITLPLMTNQQSFLDLCWATCERVKTFWEAILH
ncbi:hypothetical protein OIU77_009818, partial [Salix suchowensis]